MSEDTAKLVRRDRAGVQGDVDSSYLPRPAASTAGCDNALRVLSPAAVTRRSVPNSLLLHARTRGAASPAIAAPPSHRIASHRIVSHRVASRRIASRRRAPSRPVTLYRCLPAPW
jgi:hypothetical protein